MRPGQASITLYGGRRPIDTYDLIAIGGGTAGLVAAHGAAGLGARVALIERARLGGECLNTGCVPSKALLRSARAVRDIRVAARVGVAAGAATVDFPAVMSRMRARQAQLGRHDSEERLRAAGVDVYFGSARFTSAREVSVGQTRLRFKRAVIATGGRPTAPPIPGLTDVGYLTNETIFDLDVLPPRLLVIGAGPIGCELAQAFALFGSAVSIADVADRPLPREDADASAVVRRQLESDGVHFRLGAPLGGVRREDADAILVGAGRTAVVDGLDLDAAGVRSHPDGVIVNERLQTTNPRVFAAGDVASPYKFTHAADAMARIVVQNALFFGRRRATTLVIPWCTYTLPEVARVGEITGPAITVPLADVDRAVVDDETDGFVRVHHERGRIRGCTIVAPHAGDLIGHVAHVMRSGGSLSDLSATVFPYPTYAEALRKAGDAYRRSLLTPAARWLFRKYFRR
jgi:pyruvate/2-oxoglutarate dehydrogenase complex dihydrolipoamide dehydrogenase (E3) component